MGLEKQPDDNLSIPEKYTPLSAGQGQLSDLAQGFTRLKNAELVSIVYPFQPYFLGLASSPIGCVAIALKLSYVMAQKAQKPNLMTRVPPLESNHSVSTTAFSFVERR